MRSPLIRLWNVLTISALLALFSVGAFAQCPDTVNNAGYVRASASGAGTGTDWTNAYTSFGTGSGQLNPAAMVRGCTYYVGAGKYNIGSVVTFSTPASGSSVITLQAPTSAVHGTNTGWSNSFVGQAVWSAWTIESDSWIFNGVYRGCTGTLVAGCSGTGFPATDWRTGYGFKLYNNNGSGVPIATQATGGSSAINMGPDSTTTSNVTIEYTEIEGSGDVTGTYIDEAIFSYGGNPLNNVFYQYNWMHDTGASGMKVQGPTSGSATTTIEYNWIQNTQSSPANHGEGIALAGVSSGTQIVHLAYNYFENIEGTGNIGTPDCAGCAGSWYIYGNVFFSNVSEWHGSQDPLYSPLIAVTASGTTSTYTGTFLTPPEGTTPAKFVNSYLIVKDASNAANNGRFLITAATPTSVTVTNPGGGVTAVGQAATGTVQDGLSSYWMQYFSTGLTEVALWNNTVYSLAPLGADQNGGADCDITNGGGGNIANLYVQNNLYVNCAAANIDAPSSGTLTRNHNSYFDVATVSDTGTGLQIVPNLIPFVSVSASNFVLTEDTMEWTPLGPPYDLDLLGNARTSSRGALQFGGTPTSGAPAPPSDLTAVVN
jgi:hypothetical protein